MKIFKKMKKGFTLVELVVVIAVIAILAAVSVGAYFGVTESANNSRLEQEAKQVYTAIQTVSLAPNEHSSLSKDGLVITDDSKFELALEETLGKNVTLLENGDKAPKEPTIYFVRKDVSPAITENEVYSSFEYHVAEINGKKAVADIVTGEVKVETSDVEAGEDSSTTTAPGASSTPTTGNPTTAPGNPDISEEPQTKPTFNKITAEQSDWSGTYLIGSVVDETLYVFDGSLEKLDDTSSYVQNGIQYENDSITITNIDSAFSIEKVGNYYTIKNANNLYIGKSNSSNGLETSEEQLLHTITYNEGNVDIKTQSGIYLRFNSNKDQLRFRYYASGQKPISLFKLSTEPTSNIEVTLSSIMSNSEVNFTSLNASKTVEITAVYSNGTNKVLNNEDIEWTSNNGEVVSVDKGTITSVGIGETIVTASYEGKTFNFNVTVTIKESTASFVKVTETPVDWTGDYLIVYEDGETAYVFNGVDEVNGYVSTTITNNEIELSDNLDNCVVNISTMNEGYSLRTTNGYIYGVSGKNDLKFNTTTEQLNTLALEDDDTVTITSNTSIFRWNNDSNQKRFRYYKSGQSAVSIYKYVEKV